MPRHDLKGKENEETLPEFEQFMQLEEIESHDKVPVTKISFSKGTKVAFWFRVDSSKNSASSTVRLRHAPMRKICYLVAHLSTSSPLPPFMTLPYIGSCFPGAP